MFIHHLLDTGGLPFMEPGLVPFPQRRPDAGSYPVVLSLACAGGG